MKKTVIRKILLIVLLTLSAYFLRNEYFGGYDNTVPEIGQSESKNPQNKPPSLYISSIDENSPEQNFYAERLTSQWSAIGEDGRTVTTLTDSAGALQLSDYSEITFHVYGDAGKIAMQFSNDYQPQTVSIRRWDTKYLTMESDVGFWDEGEQIESDGNVIYIDNDGVDFIYEVHACWAEGMSYYAFCVSVAIII